jgi:lipoprotein-anchoring transpeptidase ErfK/SrfK
MPRIAPLSITFIALVLAWPQAATGQGLGYPQERDDPYADQLDDAYGDPYDPAFDRPTRALPRRNVYRGVDENAPEFDRSGRAAPQRRARVASLPADADPAYSTPLDYDDLVDPGVSTSALVDDPTGQPAGTITIDTGARKLYLSTGKGQAIEYGVGVGRQGFAWKGRAAIGRKAFWPGWTPPKEMLLRRPDLPAHMDGGLDNPLGARALYLFNGDKDTLFRIHGTNEPDTIGQAVSSGCIRMLNADVIDLYRRVSKGTRVVVR